MNKPTKEIPITDPSWGQAIHNQISEASPAQLAYLALNGSYGEKLVATLLLESIARPEASESEINPSLKGRWDV